MRNDSVVTNLMNMLSFLAILYAVSVPFYMHFEGWRLIDAVYFTTMTITTVGFGDIVPETDISKIYTMFLAFAGISVLFYHITHIGQFRERAIDPHVKSQINMLRNLTHIYGVKKRDITKIKKKMEK